MKSINAFKEGLFESAVWQAMVSIRRVLQKDADNKFKSIVKTNLGKIESIKRKDKFNKLHNNIILEIREKINQNKKHRNKKCSYGHAQKLINIFLKYYIYWYIKNRRLAEFLHCPLDKQVMDNIYEKHRQICKEFEVKPIRLSEMNKDSYENWQKVIAKVNRKYYSRRYIVELDIIFWPNKND